MRCLIIAGLGVLLPMGTIASLATGLAAMPFQIVAPFAMQQAGGRAPMWKVLLITHLSPQSDLVSCMLFAAVPVNMLYLLTSSNPVRFSISDSCCHQPFVRSQVIRMNVATVLRNRGKAKP